MIMLVMEGHIAEEQWPGLVAAYEAATKNMPAAMLQMYLTQDINDRTLWRAVTVWRSREALVAQRQSTESPRGEAMFRAAGAQPTHYVVDVAVHGSTVAA